MSYAFIELGIEKGDKIAMILTNRPEWNMIDMAVNQVGAITVPIYPTISEEDYRYILSHCDAKMVIIDGLAVMNKVTNILPDAPNVKMVYTMIDREVYPYYDQLIQLGREHPHPEELKAREEMVFETDCATIIYTSGTTGTPKGVMLSNKNLMSQFKCFCHTPSPESKVAFSFLPVCHAYERALIYMYQYNGMSIYYAESLATIADDMREIHPTMMSAVPRLLEKMYEKIIQSGKKKKGLERSIFEWSVKLTERYKIDPSKRTWLYNLKLKIADKLVYSGPIDEYFDFSLGRLDWRTVSFKTRVENTPNYQGNAVVNYTSHDEPYTRVIEHKHFEMFGQQVYDCPKTVVSEEYSTEYKPGMEQYYPVNDDKNNALAEQYRQLAMQEQNVLFGGRLAEYKYYDMAPVIEKIMSFSLSKWS